MFRPPGVTGNEKETQSSIYYYYMDLGENVIVPYIGLILFEEYR